MCILVFSLPFSIRVLLYKLRNIIIYLIHNYMNFMNDIVFAVVIRVKLISCHLHTFNLAKYVFLECGIIKD